MTSDLVFALFLKVKIVITDTLCHSACRCHATFSASSNRCKKEGCVLHDANELEDIPIRFGEQCGSPKASMEEVAEQLYRLKKEVE